ncbi:MAG: secretin and TonB N-terminal domain-containing protein [Candidatus Omnitrophica bacterium]|nr:secretin and TonB N-terminal domain-containing protein [Candidatus Omnitrophota bacterium]
MKKKNKGLIFLFMLTFILLPYLDYAQETEYQIIEFLEFREVDIKDVLRQLAKQYNLNIVFSEKVTGLITVQLSNVTLEEALDSIITVNGFVYTRKGKVIKVTTPQEALQEGKQTRLFKLNNASALSLKESLKKVLTPDGSIEADARSNSLLVTDTLSVINKIENMIPTLDEITPQVLIEARFIETSLTNTERLGIDWTTTIETTLAQSAYQFPYTLKSNFKFDPQVTTNIDLATLDFTKVKAIFDFLQSRSDAKLVANPRIVTINNHKARIHVGRKIPIPRYERNAETGRWEMTGWEMEPEKVGVVLEVTPQVNPANKIKLNLKPEVSEIVDWITDEDGNKQRPITSTREAETEVQIQDGQTVVIGGLVKNKIKTTINKIPILGDIPLLNFLFSQKELGTEEDPNEKTDLLIFVTARILRESKNKLIAWESELVTLPVEPFKLELRPIR